MLAPRPSAVDFATQPRSRCSPWKSRPRPLSAPAETSVRGTEQASTRPGSRPRPRPGAARRRARRQPGTATALQAAHHTVTGCRIAVRSPLRSTRTGRGQMLLPAIARLPSGRGNLIGEQVLAPQHGTVADTRRSSSAFLMHAGCAPALAETADLQLTGSTATPTPCAGLRRDPADHVMSSRRRQAARRPPVADPAVGPPRQRRGGDHHLGRSRRPCRWRPRQLRANRRYRRGGAAESRRHAPLKGLGWLPAPFLEIPPRRSGQR